MSELIVGLIAGLIFGVCVCMIIPFVIMYNRLANVSAKMKSSSERYNSMLSSLSSNLAGTINEIQRANDKIEMLAENYNFLSGKIDDLDSKIGGEDWKEMVEAEKQYAISLANLASYNGEEQR